MEGDLWPVEYQGKGLAKEGTDVLKNVSNLWHFMVPLLDVSAGEKASLCGASLLEKRLGVLD